MRYLFIDIETYSPVDLKSAGLYKYVESPEFRVLLFGYAFDNEAVRCIDLTKDSLGTDIINALKDPHIVKVAHNAQFERVCLSKILRYQLPIEQWLCTMALAGMHSMPLSLDACAKFLELPVHKMSEGKDLINLFSKPGKNGNTVFPDDALEEWLMFKLYNIKDVEVEREIFKVLTKYPIPDVEKTAYVVDQKINERGVLLDLDFVRNAAKFVTDYEEELRKKAEALTGIDNPKSAKQVKDYLSSLGVSADSLNKAYMPDIKAQLKGNKEALAVLDLRSKLTKTSLKKYFSMLSCVSADGRARGLYQFHGAVRTGRWAGRRIQLQNIPQNHMPDLDDARKAVKRGDYEDFTLSYSDVSGVLSELLRTALIAGEGKILAVCDFSAIEPRVLAYITKEDWVLDIFRSHGKIYEATAARMYGCGISEITKTDPRRQKGKIATLALGFGGGVGALTGMGAERLGISRNEQLAIISQWRKANANIVKFWAKIEATAKQSIMTGCTYDINGMKISYDGYYLIIRLLSGRCLYYPKARVENSEIVYEGPTQDRAYDKIKTYGGKITENIVQATARDIMREAMIACDRAGIDIVAHTHDELITEIDPNVHSLKELQDIFSRPVAWMPGLPLKGDGYLTPYYLKD